MLLRNYWKCYWCFQQLVRCCKTLGTRHSIYIMGPYSSVIISPPSKLAGLGKCLTPVNPQWWKWMWDIHMCRLSDGEGAWWVTSAFPCSPDQRKYPRLYKSILPHFQEISQAWTDGESPRCVLYSTLHFKHPCSSRGLPHSVRTHCFLTLLTIHWVWEPAHWMLHWVIWNKIF